MTDDQMRPSAMNPADAAIAEDGPATDTIPVSPSEAAPVGATTVPAPAPRASRGRWLIALAIAGVAIVGGVAVILALGKSTSPEALAYVPGNAAMVFEMRLDLPGDQLQAAGNLLAHFPGFQDQSTLSAKIDAALKRMIADAPGSSVDYDRDVKPLIGGPLFMAVQSLEGMEDGGSPSNWVVVATTNGAVSCDTLFQGQAATTEAYGGVTLSVSTDKQEACAIDGRFALAGDPAGVKAAIDAHKGNSGMNTSARYTAARTQLGLDRIATMYLDGGALAKALPSGAPGAAAANLVDALPQWVMAGVRAENDALVTDIAVAPPINPAALPSAEAYPAVHPSSFLAFAPAETLVFGEVQGFGVTIRNLVGQMASEPELGDALKSLDTFGGIDGLVGWIDDAGFIVFRDGDTPAGGVLLGTPDAATASEKVTALTTVLGLGAVGGDIEVSTSTIGDTKVTTVHVPDVSALAGAAGAGTDLPPVSLDFSIAAKDRFVIVGVGTNAMAKLVGVQPGSGLADDPAFKRALGRGLANPQVIVYVAAGATIDWLESTAALLGSSTLPLDVKAYLDPLEGLIYTTTGDMQHGGNLRFSLTVANP
jgi:hypothetical protein